MDGRTDGRTDKQIDEWTMYLRVGQMSWSESRLNVGRANVGRRKVTAVVIKPEHNFSEKSYSKKSQQYLK